MNSYQEEINNILKYDLCNLLKEYLKLGSLDGRIERQQMRKDLKEILNKIDNLQKKADENTDR